MKKLLLSALITLVPLTGMSATILGIQAGGGTWTHSPSGDITASVADTGASADLKDDLNLADKTEGYTYFVFEHPVPVIPNLKYVDTKLSSAGSGTANANFSFNGQTYNTSTALTTSLVLDQTDTILYYEILDNDLISIDFGLNGKGINGKASIDDGVNPVETTSFSATIPLLYLAAEVGLPYGFSIVAEASTLSLGGNQISDTTAKLTYTSDYYFGLEAGVRTINTKIDVDSVNATMNFSGVFAGLYFKF